MFQHNSFLRASFSVQSFKMAGEENTARSGYWRLFYYNLQEESLKQDEQKQREEKKVGAGESQEVKSPEAPTKRKRKPEPIEVVEEWVPPFIPRPIYQAKKSHTVPEIDDLLRESSLGFLEWRGIITSMSWGLAAQISANDDEEDIELLLLAA